MKKNADRVKGSLYLSPNNVLLMTKLSILLVFSFSMVAYADGFSQYAKVTLRLQDAKINELLSLVEHQTPYRFVYANELFNSVHKTIDVEVKDQSVVELLTDILENTGLTFELYNKYLVVLKPKPVPGTSKLQQEIRGRVTDRSGAPLAGVTVVVKGTHNVTVTDDRGAFRIAAAPGATLSVTSVGFEPQEVVLTGSASPLTIVLQSLVSTLEETVVVAYGQSKVKDLTGSVARVGEAEIANAPLGSSIQGLLQGRASGVNVAIQSASPTSPVSVIIRGASSLTGDNQPLWVIDGVPDYTASTSGNVANTLYNLNINDVESIDILKDASATALYGSRAANGVVLVTTRRGREGQRPTIEFSSRAGLQVQDFNEYRYFDAEQYIDFADKAAREEAFGRGSFDYFTRLYLDEQDFLNKKTSEFDRSDFKVLEGAYYEGNTNWLNEMTQNAWTQQHTLSLRGGTEGISYYVSFNNNRNQGVVKTGQSNLYGGRINLEANINQRVKFGMNLSGSSRGTDDKDYMLDVLKKIRPDIPAYNEDGSLFTRDAYTENPYTTLLNTQAGDGKLFNGTGFLEIRPIKELLFRTAFTAGYSNTENLSYKRRGSTFNYDGSRSWSSFKSNTIVWENTLTYVKTFNDHDILALTGFSLERNNGTTYSMSASNFPDDDVLNNFPSGANRGALGESYGANSLASVFARGQYKFKNRYIVSGTLRRDGSSRFGPDRRWGTFPSAAVAWLLHEEHFFKNSALVDYISYFKLRASRGTAGSQNLGNYAWRSYISSARYNESPAIVPSSVGNTELRWEQTRLTDAGIDFGFWQERIRGTIGVYEKLSDDLIYSSPLPPSSAFSSVSSNVASIKNNGIEFDIKVDVVKNTDLTLTIDYNGSKNSGEVLKINGITKELLFPSSYYPYMKLEEGGKTGQWFGYQTAGRLFVTQEEIIALQSETATGAKQYYRNSLEYAGDLLFLDNNGDGRITDDDRVYIGSSEPKLFGGFGLTAIYKNLYANATFTYAYGHKRLWSMPMEDVGYVGNYNHSNKVAGQSATLLSPYEATIPRMTQYGDGGNSTFSDFWLYDASYVRLSAINLSYRLPSGIFGRSVVQGIDLTFQASNLFTLTSYPGFDPQGNWSSSTLGAGMGIDESIYPSARNYNFGVKVTFK